MKLKSHSSTKKRVKVTGRGKIRLQKSAKQHLLAQKSKRQKKLYRGGKRQEHPPAITISLNFAFLLLNSYDESKARNDYPQKT